MLLLFFYINKKVQEMGSNASKNVLFIYVKKKRIGELGFFVDVMNVILLFTMSEAIFS